MKDTILSICLGNDSKNLLGCKNDSILIYNLIMEFVDKELEEKWLTPYLLFNENITEKKIKNIIKNSDIFNKLFIYYSGHGLLDGSINIFTNNMISDINFIKVLDSYISSNIELYIILDSCYAGSFKILPYNKIKKIHLIGSTKSNQKANESIINFNNLEKNIRYYKNSFNLFEDNIILGMFTYNFYNLLKKSIYSINNWNKILDDNIWYLIDKNLDQFPIIFW